MVQSEQRLMSLTQQLLDLKWTCSNFRTSKIRSVSVWIDWLQSNWYMNQHKNWKLWINKVWHHILHASYVYYIVEAVIISRAHIQKKIINLYHSLGKLSRWQINDIFLIFSRKQDLTFHANCLLRRQNAWSVKSCFLGKVRENISKCHLLKFSSRVLSMNFYLSLAEHSR